MRKVYVLKNNKIEVQFILAVMETHEGQVYYYLGDSENSMVNFNRPTMTPKDITFESPQKIVDMLMMDWHETKSTEHEGQLEIEFPKEEAYPTDEIRVGTMRMHPTIDNPDGLGTGEIYNGYNWMSLESLEGNELYRRHHQADIGNGLT